MPNNQQRMSPMCKLFFKRMFDFLISLCAILLLSPVLLVISLIIKYQQGGDVFFKQERPGLNKRIFKVIKFKTMSDEKDVNGMLLPDKDRITPIGRFIRSTSLDEIPQLLNVLKGDMALIGPRPLLIKYLPLYSDIQSRRHEVRPGITGWAQVNGRNAISWERKLELDVWYVDNFSFLLDLKIVLLTLKKIIKREDINQVGQATMEPFKGTSEISQNT